MVKKIVFIITLINWAISVHSQDIYSNLFYNDLSVLNPAYVGMLEENRATFYTCNYNDKDRDYVYSMGRAALNIPLAKINSGIGVYSSFDSYTKLSDYYFGFIYSFKYAINDNIKISIGSDFSMIRKKGTVYYYYDFPRYTNENISFYNIDVGIWLNLYGLQIGLTNKHINEPSKKFHFFNGTGTFKLKSSINTIFNYDFQIGGNHKLSNSILIYNLKDFFDSKYLVINNQFAVRNKLLVGLSTEINLTDHTAYISPNLGLNLSDQFNFMVSMDLIKINLEHSLGNFIEAVLNYNF